ncbi:MAG: response regulator [bacterium]|nr:response regulator [bacterium]
MAKVVMIVDNEPEVIASVSAALEKLGCQNTVSRNGEEALNRIKQNKPELIVMDLLLPKYSGIRLYQDLKTTESLKKIPVIIISGITKKTFLRSLEELSDLADQAIPEPDAYFEKPLKLEEFEPTLQRLVK